MAEVIGRNGLITSAQQQHQHRSHIHASNVTIKNSASRFPGVKLTGSVLRSSTGGGVFGRLTVGERRIYQPAISAQMTAGIIGRSHKWWEKGIQPNMKEVTSAQDLVDSLANAGSKLVVLEFFSRFLGQCWE